MMNTLAEIRKKGSVEQGASTPALPPLAGFWTFVGDIHGRPQDLPKPGHPVVQVGDMGIGFIREEEDVTFLRHRDDLWFIRGNHDNPFACQNHPRYLGDWGQHEFMFWVSGAWSVDQNFRVEGVSWWREEELSAKQGSEAFDAYVTAKPRLMVTHDAPSSLFMNHGPMELGGFRPSATSTLLQSMLEAHQPEIWLFGHHHESRDFTIDQTHFRCLDCSECAVVYIENGSMYLA
jgi:hypothetical protein